MKATVFDIKRFAVHDGPGIRTTVFFKGCSLKCLWCHNPEGIGFAPQLAYYSEKCLSCGDCARVCPQNAHKTENGGHIFDRYLCIGCGKCESVCYAGALKFYGKTMTPRELLELVMEDKDFYDTSKGGVTLSGGECLCQADFCREFLKLLKENGINTAVDTCGMVSKEAIKKVLPYTDMFLYDIKALDNNVHINCTGKSNLQILDNIKYIDSQNKEIEVRIPFVPGLNSDEIEKIAGFLCTLNNLKSVKVLPYHNFSGSKYEALGIKNTMPDTIPVDDEIKNAQRILYEHGIKVNN